MDLFSALRVTLGEMHRSPRRFAKAANLLTMTPSVKETVSPKPLQGSANTLKGLPVPRNRPWQLGIHNIW